MEKIFETKSGEALYARFDQRGHVVALYSNNLHEVKLALIADKFSKDATAQKLATAILASIVTLGVKPLKK